MHEYNDGFCLLALNDQQYFLPNFHPFAYIKDGNASYVEEKKGGEKRERKNRKERKEKKRKKRRKYI